MCNSTQFRAAMRKLQVVMKSNGRWFVVLVGLPPTRQTSMRALQNCARDALWTLVHLLATMKNDRGRRHHRLWRARVKNDAAPPPLRPKRGPAAACRVARAPTQGRPGPPADPTAPRPDPAAATHGVLL